jgi:hypothetical protein
MPCHAMPCHTLKLTLTNSQVTKGLKEVPQGLTTLLGDCLRQSGVEVCYSVVDNDDTLAYHAHHDGTKDAPVFVLSDDKVCMIEL